LRNFCARRKFRGMETWNEQLRRVRKSRGLRQDAVGQMVGVTAATISRYECGEMEPSLATARLLVDAFGGDLDPSMFFPAAQSQAAD
jgi:transcriptional regulator with XRE-family HTH domain